jgi:ribosomal protein L19
MRRGVVLDEARAGHHKARRVLRVFEGVPVETRAVDLFVK